MGTLRPNSSIGSRPTVKNRITLWEIAPRFDALEDSATTCRTRLGGECCTSAKARNSKGDNRLRRAMPAPPKRTDG